MQKGGAKPMGMSIDVLVLDDDDRPVEGAKVVAQFMENDWFVGCFKGGYSNDMTDEDGHIC